MAKKRGMSNEAAADNAEPTTKKRGRPENAEQVAQPKRMRWADEAALEPSYINKVSTSCMVACLQTLLMDVHIGEYKSHDGLPAEMTAARLQTKRVSGSSFSSVTKSTYCTVCVPNLLGH